MEIRNRLTLQFTVIVAVILILAEFSIYLFSELKWKEDFNGRLFNKATAVTKLLLDVEGIDADIIRLIEKNNLSTLPFEEIHIYDHTARLIFASRDSSSLLITSEMINFIQYVDALETTQGKYTVIGFTYSGINDQIIVIAGAIDIYGMRKLSNLRNILLIVFLTSLVILYFTGRLFSNRALKPILKVIDEVPAITESTLHLRVDEGNGKDEVARLAQTFNRMLTRIEDAFTIHKSFIANASHEIRTPLAHITGRMEVALLKKRTQEEYISVIQSVLADIVSLGNTANRLLLLTMTNSESYKIPMDVIRVDDLLWEAQTELMTSHADYKVMISFEEDFTGDADAENMLSVMGNDQLIRIVFLNLMENACKYSEDHRVQIILDHQGNHIRILFRDEGLGIALADQEFIFEPFYRAKNVSHIQGSGLGLSLVKRITELHGGTLSMNSIPGSGTDFYLRFPMFRE